MAAPHVRTEHGRMRSAQCSAILKGEKDPLGRDWNSQTTEEERRFWLQAAGQPLWLAKKPTWAELPDTAKHALRAALARVAARGRHLLQGAVA